MAQLFIPSIAVAGDPKIDDAVAVPPLDERATLYLLPGVGDGTGVGVGLGLGATVGVGLGATVGLVLGWPVFLWLGFAGLLLLGCLMIDGLRMVRGNAKDLVLPPPGSDEFIFLARRVGYTVPRNGRQRRRGNRPRHQRQHLCRRHRPGRRG